MKADVTVKENYEFRRIYRRGKTAVSPTLVIYCQKNRHGRTRLGVTVSTKLGGAVIRNRIRRRLREIWRLNRPSLQDGWDVILVARGRAVRADYRRLNADYLRLLKATGLYREEETE